MIPRYIIWAIVPILTQSYTDTSTRYGQLWLGYDDAYHDTASPYFSKKKTEILFHCNFISEKVKKDTTKNYSLLIVTSYNIYKN